MKGACSQLLRSRGVQIDWTHIGGDPRQRETAYFRMTLSREGRDGEPLVVWTDLSYSMGCRCFAPGGPVEPEIEGFLECLCSDLDAAGLSVSEYLRDYGNEREPVHARAKVWEELQRVYQNVTRVLGEALRDELIDCNAAALNEEDAGEEAEDAPWP